MFIYLLVRWLAVVTSIVMLIGLWTAGELGRRGVIILFAWLLAAGYCQFFGRSTSVYAIGLGLQTVLAIYLVLRWRLAE
jgi:hypothetical protein